MSLSLACIGGTAAYDLLHGGALVAERIGAVRTPFGESQPIYLCRTRHGEFHFLSRHGESRLELAPTFVNYRANIYALKELGVRSIVSWSETRAICHNYKIGCYVLVNDLVDETHMRPITFFENRSIGQIRQCPVFCPTLRAATAAALNEEDCKHSADGVYVCVEGPRRETPAEVRKYAAFGGDLLGTSLVPEVFLAKELQMCYASICYVAAYAETGSDFRPFENGQILDASTQILRAQRAVERLPRILERLCDVLPRTPVTCTCGTTLEHHIASGHIGGDWRTWIGPGNNGAPFAPNHVGMHAS